MKGRFINDSGKALGSKRMNFEDPRREQASVVEPPMLSDERALAPPGPMTYISAPHGQEFQTLRRVEGRRSLSLGAARNLQESEEMCLARTRVPAAAEEAHEGEAAMAAELLAAGGVGTANNATATGPLRGASPEPAVSAAAGIQSERLDSLNIESRRRFDFNELEAQLAPDFLAGRFTWSPRSLLKKRSNGRGHWTDVVAPELLPTAVTAPTPPPTLHQLPAFRSSAMQRQQHSPSRQQVTVCTPADRGTAEEGVWLDDSGSKRLTVIVEPPRKTHTPQVNCTAGPSEASTRAPTAQPSANHSPVTTPRSRISPRICHRNVEVDLPMAKASPLPPPIPVGLPVLLGSGQAKQPAAPATSVQSQPTQQPVKRMARPTSAHTSSRKWRP